MCDAIDHEGKPYNWCPRNKTVYSDGDKHYCVFHAPKDKKEMSNEDFSRLVNEKLLQSNNISGTIIPGYIHITPLSTYSSYSFMNVKFYGKVKLNAFKSKIIFDFAEFYAEANFENVKFINNDVDFKSTEFHCNANFSGATIKKANFESTKFFGDVKFNGCTFEEQSIFKKVTFGNAAYFIGLIIKSDNGILFINSNLHNTRFLNTDLRACKFIRCNWNEINDRYVIHDELDLNKQNDNYFDSLRAVESLYRAQKQKAKEDHHEIDVSKWHYSEKEMQRKKLALEKFKSIGKFSNWFILWVYNLLCGYGENYQKASKGLLGVIIFAIISLGLAGIENSQKDIIAFTTTLNFSISRLWEIILTTLEHLTFSKSPEYKPIGQWGRSLILLFKILVPVQVAFLGFSLRNRFRR